MKKTGFTLIELLIAIGIFSVFIVIMTGVFSRFVEVERHSIAQGALILDVQSAIESFVKEARTGYGSTYDTDGSKQIAFRNQSGVCVGYRLNIIKRSGEKDRGALERAEDDTLSNCRPNNLSSASYTALTGKDTNISELRFVTTRAREKANTGRLEEQGFITNVLTASR